MYKHNHINPYIKILLYLLHYFVFLLIFHLLYYLLNTLLNEYRINILLNNCNLSKYIFLINVYLINLLFHLINFSFMIISFYDNRNKYCLILEHKLISHYVLLSYYNILYLTCQYYQNNQ